MAKLVRLSRAGPLVVCVGGRKWSWEGQISPLTPTGRVGHAQSA
jgi:hypothetical protein